METKAAIQSRSGRRYENALLQWRRRAYRDDGGYARKHPLSGQGPGQRKEIFYFDDSGSLNAFRYGDWKVTFATKDSRWADVAKPRTVPLVVNLRQYPFEVTPDAKMYERWYGDKLWVMVPAQAIVGQFLMSFKEFPQLHRSMFSKFWK